jgi:RNA-directed DNA polymerase
MAAPLPSPTDLAAFRSLRSIDDLAKLLGTSRRRLFFHLYSPGRPHYRFFKIAKASGSDRLIASPPKLVALFQHKLLSCLTAIVIPKSPVHGFTSRRSVATNAKQHVPSRLVLNIDLLDFFPSVHFGRVKGLFAKRPFNFPNEVATVLAQIFCVNGSLPQGASTSPIISNLICRGLDRDLEAFGRKNACVYTRYADDITISTARNHFEPAVIDVMPTLQNRSPILGVELQQIFTKHDFRINTAKTRVRTFHERQEVTGLIVNEKVNVPREFVRNIRAILHDCETRGLPAANARFQGTLDRKSRKGSPPPLLAHVRGKLDYLRMVRGRYDELYVKLAVRAHAITPMYNYGIPVAEHLAMKHHVLANAIWIVLGKDANGTNVVQGTAFSLDGVGIISARHVFNNPCANGYSVHRWEIFKPSAPTQLFRVNGFRDHTSLDLTIIDLRAPHSFCLIAAETSARSGDSLIVAGYPQWLTLADRLAAARCEAIQTRTISGVRFVLTNAYIREGNSGGPILDGNGHVVAVALYDGLNISTPNAGIEISHLADILTAPRRSV